MRCHVRDEESVFDQSGFNIWTSSIQNPSILDSMENINEIEAKSCSDALSTLCTLDSVSQSCKRKILEREKEDFEDRFNTLQKKRQMLRAAAKAHLNNDDDFVEAGIFEQMDWIEDENNAMTLHWWKDKDVNLSIQSINSNSSIMYIPKFSSKEEKRHLLSISMAKIRGVDDPETYLRRSVLINNTVKRLQKDVAINYRFQPLPSTSLFHENTVDNMINNWDLGNPIDEIASCRHNYFEENDLQYNKHVNDLTSDNIYPDNQTTSPNKFHLSVIAPYSSDNTMHSFQSEVLQNSVSSKSIQDDQCDPSFSCRTLKSTNSVHMYSSQPCGLQYRNTLYEACNYDFQESNSSSLLDSVIYHSLIASLET